MQIDTELLRILRIKGMLGIHKRTSAPGFLHLGNDLQRERGFARRFRPVDFDHPSARKPPHTQGNVQPERSGADRLNVFHGFTFPQAHDAALAKLFLDLGQRGLQGFGFFGLVGNVAHENSP